MLFIMAMKDDEYRSMVHESANAMTQQMKRTKSSNKDSVLFHYYFCSNDESFTVVYSFPTNAITL